MLKNHELIQPSVSDVDQSIRKNNYKLTADKIKQILNDVRNTPSKSYRRWVWELMQNAKDVPNQFGRVSVQIILKEDQLIFKHNGDPFSIDNITGLIQQVSSKASDSSDEAVTGKFGTGFISTHLLSDIIEVKGYVRRLGNQYRHFNLTLDRSGETSEELLPKIEAATERIRQIDNEAYFKLKEHYGENRKEEDYDTVFTYDLSTEEKKRAAQEGIEDLKNTLPLTMVNISKIKKVEVINEIDDTETYYECIIYDTNDLVTQVTVKAMWDAPFETRNFLVYKTEQVALTAEVNNFEELHLIEHFGKQPNLYRDFPLIGSEKFHFPFVLNGFQFFPNQDRDSIHLNSEDSKDAQQNRKIVAAAQEAAVEFTKKLIELGAKNLYVATYTRFPEIHFEDKAKEWYLGVQEKWRAALAELTLVETEAGELKKINECFIPYHGDKDETKLEFHELALDYLGSQNIPRKDILLNWIKCAGPKAEMETWQDEELFFDIEQLMERIQENEEIDQLELEFEDELDGQEAEEEKYKWLNDLFEYIYRAKQSELLNEYAVVPNQYGKFKKLVELHEEDKNAPIPDAFLDVLKALGVDWRDDLINRAIDFEGLNHQKRHLGDITENINGFLKNDIKDAAGKTYKNFLEFPAAPSILVQILRTVEEGSTRDAFRHRLFLKAKDILYFEDDFDVVPNSAKFNYAPAIKLMIQLVNQVIEVCETIEGLAKKLDKDEDSTILWLDNYLRLLEGNSEYKSYLEDANIIPNRYHDLCAYDEIHAFGTEDNPLDEDLIKILTMFDPEDDWFPDLVADGIGIQLSKTLKIDELCNAVWENIRKINGDDSFEEYRKAILEFIDWGKNNEDLVARNLNGFNAFADRAFFILMIERSEHGSQVMQLFKDEEQVEAMAKIAESGVSISKLLELAEISGKLGSMDGILSHAQDLLKEEEEFIFLRDLGETIEDVFRKALDNFVEGLEVVYQGHGARDFIIRNPKNKKQFSIELKSHAYGKNDSIKMALSQAKLCLRDPDNFALCVVERPQGRTIPRESYLRSQIKWVSVVSEVIAPPIKLYNDFHSQKSGLQNASLEVPLREQMKVSIKKGYIDHNYDSFDSLIQRITAELC